MAALNWTSIRDGTAARTIAAPSHGPAVVGWAIVLAMLIAAWAVTMLAGGTRTAAPHAFYVPIIVAAVRFRAVGALVAAVLGGLLCGLFVPLDVAAGSAQAPSNWVTRMLLFVAIGQLTAYLHRYSLPTLSGEVSARRFRRKLRESIERGHVQVAYQPIIDLTEDRIAGVEALVRYRHPTGGTIPPDQFVREAERAQCIGEVTRFVLGEACGQVAAWRRSGLIDREFHLAVNISGADLTDESLVENVAGALRRTGLPNESLHLEITETALVGDPEVAELTMARLCDLRVHLAIDDFGTGESSLGYLDRFPVDVLKIDRTFVRRLTDRTPDDALTNGICAMAHAMGMDVVAEGVETQGQAASVQRFGCRYAQGFLWSPPVGADELRSLLEPEGPFATRLR